MSGAGLDGASVRLGERFFSRIRWLTPAKVRTPEGGLSSGGRLAMTSDFKALGATLRDNSATNCGTNPTNPGCACSSAGQSASCWTGPANMRGVGACHDGTAQCLQAGGVHRPVGSVPKKAAARLRGGDHVELAVAPNRGRRRNGPRRRRRGRRRRHRQLTGRRKFEDGGGIEQGKGRRRTLFGCTCSDADMHACSPGAVIGCDNDCSANLYCAIDAFQECLPNGSWGPCHEIAGMNTGLSGCWHDQGNCSDCNNGGGQYLGDCSGVVECH